MQHESITQVLLLNHVNVRYKELANESASVASFSEGIERVNRGGFAMFDDTLWLQYNSSDNCDIFFVGEMLLKFFFSFFEKNSVGEKLPYIFLKKFFAGEKLLNIFFEKKNYF